MGLLIHELRLRGIPASEEGGTPLTNSAAVQVILSLLRMADHPSNTAARFHLAHSPLGAAQGMDANGADDAFAGRLARRIRAQLYTDGYGLTLQRWAAELDVTCSAAERARLEQFIELAYAYTERATLRPTDFVRYIERRRVNDPSSAAVRVMTIHQAKGLEFDRVVVTDLDQPLVGKHEYAFGRHPESHRACRICKYEPSNVQCYLPAEEIFSEDLARRLDEAMCNAYVALTRPKYELQIVVKPTSSGKPGRNLAGLICSALAAGKPLKPERKLYEAGDPNWAETLAQDWLPPRRLLSGGSQHVPSSSAMRNPRAPERKKRCAPSRLKSYLQALPGEVFRPHNRAGRLYGTVIHGWFELITWLDDGSPTRKALRGVWESLVGMDPVLDFDTVANDFSGLLAQPSVKQILGYSSYTDELNDWYQQAGGNYLRDVATVTVHNEQRIALSQPHQIMAGSINRLIIVSESGQPVAADIIDFKTDRVTDSKSTLVNNYRPQVKTYRVAISRMLEIDPAFVRARLLFLAADAVHEV